MTHHLESDLMRTLFLSAIAALLAGTLATAQEALEQAQEIVEQTIEEATEATDLGDSVDDLLESTLGSSEDTPATDTQDVAAPDEPAVIIAEETVASGPAAANTPTSLELGSEDPTDEPEVSNNVVGREITSDVGVVVEPFTEQPTVKQYDKFEVATLRGLDKITGRSTDMDVSVNDPIVFGALNIEMKACFKTPPELPPESAAFLDIKSIKGIAKSDATDSEGTEGGGDELPQLFSGWMFASSPGLSALEHPVYDVWVISCKAS